MKINNGALGLVLTGQFVTVKTVWFARELHRQAGRALSPGTYVPAHPAEIHPQMQLIVHLKDNLPKVALRRQVEKLPVL